MLRFYNYSLTNFQGVASFMDDYKPKCLHLIYAFVCLLQRYRCQCFSHPELANKDLQCCQNVGFQTDSLALKSAVNTQMFALLTNKEMVSLCHFEFYVVAFWG